MENPDLFIQRRFGISIDKFFDILNISPGAEGYILGSLGEQLFKEYAENKGFEVLRIKEKPEGGNNAKADDARGDFYIRKKGVTENKWYVVECKSVKSNAEERTFIGKQDKEMSKRRTSCINFLKKYSIDRKKTIASLYRSGLNKYISAVNKWEEKGEDRFFPPFRWSKTNPGPGVPDLRGIWRDEYEITDWINSFPDEYFTSSAFYDLKAPIRLIQTHMPSTRIDELGIKSTGPLVLEFNILCIDLFLRTGEHELVFANSKDLNHQAAAPNHLQQNYNIDILIEKDGYKRHATLKPWYDDIDKLIQDTDPTSRPLDETQLDQR